MQIKRDRSSSRGGRSKRKGAEGESCVEVWEGVVEYLMLGGGQPVLERVVGGMVGKIGEIVSMFMKDTKRNEPSVLSVSVVNMLTGEYYSTKQH